MINLNKKDKIAIMFSGGVESVFAYYLILQQNLLGKCLDLYLLDKYSNPTHLVEYLYQELKVLWKDDISTFSIMNFDKNVLENKKIKIALGKLQNYDIVFYGLNKYPDDTSIRPVHSFNTFSDEWIENLYKQYPNVSLPFIDMSKDVVIQHYYDNNIADILPKTLSCGSSNIRVCGKCFNCREREWAYNKLNIEVNLGL